jgi:inner membrane protein involved in colicin E2 resistance
VSVVKRNTVKTLLLKSSLKLVDGLLELQVDSDLPALLVKTVVDAAVFISLMFLTWELIASVWRVSLGFLQSLP